MKNIVKFKKQELTDMDLPGNSEHLIEEKIIGHGRWTVDYEIVFEKDGKFWGTGYSIGATESQDERPWQYQKEIECVEMHRVSKLVEVWEEKDL